MTSTLRSRLGVYAWRAVGLLAALLCSGCEPTVESPFAGQVSAELYPNYALPARAAQALPAVPPLPAPAAAPAPSAMAYVLAAAARASETDIGNGRRFFDGDVRAGGSLAVTAPAVAAFAGTSGAGVVQFTGAARAQGLRVADVPEPDGLVRATPAPAWRAWVGRQVSNFQAAIGAIGSYWSGALDRRYAKELPAAGPGFRVYGGARWGTPNLVSGLQDVAQEHSRMGGTTLLIGDLSRERGGKFGRHASHANGKDADVRLITDGQGRVDVAQNLNMLRLAITSDRMYVVRAFVHEYYRGNMLRHAARLVRDGKMSLPEFRHLTGILFPDADHVRHLHIRIA